MTLTADITTVHGAVLRSGRPAGEPLADSIVPQTSPDILPRVEPRIFTVFPERSAHIEFKLRKTARRRIRLIGMCAPISVFLALAAWYLTL